MAEFPSLVPSALARPSGVGLLGERPKNQPFVNPRVWLTSDFPQFRPQLLTQGRPRLQDVCKRVVCVFELAGLTPMLAYLFWSAHAPPVSRNQAVWQAQNACSV